MKATMIHLKDSTKWKDVRMDEEILANVSSFNEQNTEISDGENKINSELEEENESDYDSDGH